MEEICPILLYSVFIVYISWDKKWGEYEKNFNSEKNIAYIPNYRNHRHDTSLQSRSRSTSPYKMTKWDEALTMKSADPMHNCACFNLTQVKEPLDIQDQLVHLNTPLMTCTTIFMSI